MLPFIKVDYSKFNAAVTKSLEANNLQTIKITYVKIIQLYETMCSRHSIMLVGQTQVGKTVAWKTLQVLFRNHGFAFPNNIQLTPALTDCKGLTICICYGLIFVNSNIKIKDELFKGLKNNFCYRRISITVGSVRAEFNCSSKVFQSRLFRETRDPRMDGSTD